MYEYICSQDETNTFRVALVTDGSTSFVIFIYSELKWYQVDLRSASGSGASGSGTSANGASGSSPLPVK